MIFDDFKNFKLYDIDPEIVDFILNIDPSISNGRHEIKDGAYINIEEYETRDFIKFEAHKNHIDIQFLINGDEKVYITETEGLETSIPYDSNKDVEFFKTPNKPLNTCYLSKNKFIVLYPNDAHSPCTKVENPICVKKAIVKIKI